jgi:hypothetical protein
MLRLAPSLNWPKWASTWPMSCRSTIGVRPKWFSSLWYLRRKPCTHLTLRLTLSPDRPKPASTWPHHLGVRSGVPKAICKQKEHQCKPCTYLALRLTLSPKRTETSFHFTHVT